MPVIQQVKWGLESKEGGVETEADVPKGGNQWHGARVFAVAPKVNQMNYLSGKKNGEDCAPGRLAYQLSVWGWPTKLARVPIAHAEPLVVP